MHIKTFFYYIILRFLIIFLPTKKIKSLFLDTINTIYKRDNLEDMLFFINDEKNQHTVIFYTNSLNHRVIINYTQEFVTFKIVSILIKDIDVSTIVFKMFNNILGKLLYEKSNFNLKSDYKKQRNENRQKIIDEIDSVI